MNKNFCFLTLSGLVTGYQLDTRLIDTLGQQIVDQYSDHLQDVQVGTQIRYGCWCLFEVQQLGANKTVMILDGKGKPMDDVDRFCKILARGYRCVFIDSNLEENCSPWTIDYSTGDSHTCPDNGGDCSENTCQVENYSALRNLGPAELGDF